MYKHAILALATASGLLMAAEPASAEKLPVHVTCGGEDAVKIDVPSPPDDMTVGELRERLLAMSARSWAPVHAAVRWQAPSGTSIRTILLDGLRACRGARTEQKAAAAADVIGDDTEAFELGMLGSPDVATMLETLVADPPACWPTFQAATDEETDEETDEVTDADVETDEELDEETDSDDEAEVAEETEVADAQPAALLDAIGLRELLDAVLAGPVTCAPGTAPTSFFTAPTSFFTVPEVPLVTYEPSLMDRLGLSAALDRVLGG
ncbi:hypothetical protein [Nonomuraea bangladeshensis]|uniref:hypothetical protein n=1 Tax=Nonomuraea bangladeshensis TaxID=404385 RepID=UPI003C2E6C97